MFFNRRIPSLIRTSYYYHSLGGFLWGIFHGLSIILIPVIARKIGASNVQMGCLTAVPFIGSLFCFIWAQYSHKRKKLPFVIITKGIARGMLFFIAFSTNLWFFIAIIFLFYFFEFAGAPAWSGILKDIYPEEERSKAMGYVQVEMLLAIILTSYIAGYLLDLGPQSYQYVLPGGVIFGLLSLKFLRKIRVESDGKIITNKKRISLKRIVNIFQKDKRYLYLSSIFFIFGFGNLLSLPLYPIFLIDNLKIPLSVAGKLAALTSLIWLISSIFWAEYMKEKYLKVLSLVFLLASFTPLFYFLASNIYLVTFAAVSAGIVSGGLWLAWINYIMKIAEEKNVQVYWGIQQSLMGVRGIIAPFIGIALMHFIGIKGVFFLSFLITFVAFVLLSLFRRQEVKIGNVSI